MKNMMSFFRKNGFYVMALVLIAGILAISGIAGYVSGQSERNQAENAAEFKDRAAGTASNEAKLAESEAAVADEMTGYNADLVQKILSMIENGTLALEDFEEEGSMNGTAEASAKDAAAAEKPRSCCQQKVPRDPLPERGRRWIVSVVSSESLLS